MSFEKGHEAIKKLLNRATEKDDDGQRLHMADFKNVLEWGRYPEANEHSARREEAHEDISRSHSAAASYANPS